ncbi:MAG: ABC transporter permease [Spirochaetales bacterium]|nr:ABC transporter permease [Spirochaetales bacterium]
MVLKIAFKNLLRQKRRNLLNAFTIISGFIIAAVTISLIDGMLNNVVNVFTGSNMGHVQIHAGDYRINPSLYKTIGGIKALDAELNGVNEIKSWSYRIYSVGLASVEDKSTAVQITGIEPDRESNNTQFDRKISKGDNLSAAGKKEILLGEGLAKTLNADINDEVAVISQGADGSIANDLYRITGLVNTGDKTKDKMSVYLHLKQAQELLVLGDEVHEAAIVVDHLDNVEKVVVELKKLLKGTNLQVESWKEFAHSFYTIMESDKNGIFKVIFIIIIVVGMGVLNSILMSVLERRREYGILKALGTKPLQIFNLIFFEIMFLSLICICVSNIIAIPIMYFLSIYGIPLPEPISMGGSAISIKALVAEINSRSIIVPAVTVLISAIAASLIPGIMAAKIEPAKTMRMH